MKLKELFEILDGDTYIRINDKDNNSCLECDASNSLIQTLGEVSVEEIYSEGTIEIAISQKG